MPSSELIETRPRWPAPPPARLPHRRPRSARRPALLTDDLGALELIPLADIRPTQMAVGMRAVEARRRKIERRCGSIRKMKRYLEKRAVPAVLGPGEEPYIIDHHHLSLALWQSEVDEVFVRVVGDFSDLPQRSFLRTMAALGWLHSFDAMGRKVCPTQLPRTLDRLRPDRYRDLAWSVREAGGFRKTPVPFAEFAWANYFRAEIPRHVVGRDFENAHERAMALARSWHARHLPGHLRGG